MIKLTRLNGEVIYLNYFLIQCIELIPETKIRMANGDYYLVKDSIDTILQLVSEALKSCIDFDKKIV